jgi:stress-induced morphogen
MIIQNEVEDILKIEFTPTHLEVINESGNHNVPAGSESHFRVVVVSEKFVEVKLLERHKMVNKALFEMLRTKIHALAIVAKTPEQWGKAKSTGQSPVCHSKK